MKKINTSENLKKERYIMNWEPQLIPINKSLLHTFTDLTI